MLSPSDIPSKEILPDISISYTYIPVSSQIGRHLEIRAVILSAAKDLLQAREILRCAQDDSQDTPHVRSRQALSPNVYQISVAERLRCTITTRLLSTGFWSQATARICITGSA